MQYPTVQEQKQKRNKTIAAWSLAAIIIAASVWGVVRLAESSKTAIESQGVIPAVSQTDQIRGNPSAKVLIYEYADYQCPACQQTDPILRQILGKYPNDVALVYRNFPLKTIHSTAMIAAAAAEAAAKQGKFWEMHDLLYANQAVWSDQPNAADLFAGYAVSIGLDGGRFKADLQSPEITSKIQADYDEAVRLNLDHTPTIGINGRLLSENPAGYAGFEQLVQEYLNR